MRVSSGIVAIVELEDTQMLSQVRERIETYGDQSNQVFIDMAQFARNEAALMALFEVLGIDPGLEDAGLIERAEILKVSVKVSVLEDALAEKIFLDVVKQVREMARTANVCPEGFELRDGVNEWQSFATGAIMAHIGERAKASKRSEALRAEVISRVNGFFSPEGGAMSGMRELLKIANIEGHVAR